MKKLVLTSFDIDELKEMFRQIVSEELSKQMRATIHPSVFDSNGLHYLTRKEVAKLLGITLPTLSQWTKSGKITAYRIGRRVKYKPSEVDQALKKIKTE